MPVNRILVAVAVIAIVASCARDDNGGMLSSVPNAACSATRPIALAITVRDSISGRALADSASGSFRVDAITDTLMRYDSLTLIGGPIVGSYDVTVQRPGYRTWTAFGISATQTRECGGVAPVKLTAPLQRLP
jgi:hypothetical protein